MRHLNIIFIFITVILFLTGCATSQPVRAPKQLAETNPMQKIALLAAATVDWPTHFFKERRLGMTASRNALTNLLNHNKEELISKGYNIVLALPVGIGYYPNSELVDIDNNTIEKVVFENYLEEGDKSKIDRTKQVNPIYAYPNSDTSQSINSAAQAILQFFEQEIENRQKRGMHKTPYHMYTQYLELDYMPIKNQIDTIAEETGADTVCLLRIVGKQYTQARKDATQALSFLFGGGGNGTEDRLSTLTSCISTQTKITLWQYGVPPVFGIRHNPTNPHKSFTQYMLRYFPGVGSPISNLCKSKRAGLFICKKPKEEQKSGDS